ncbi:ABC transporter ATP-binding protein [Inconstantimicrobium mannanitabidum]|nr:ABC transporter ATP-binding protein [Clostridium sp. TW13]
MGKNIKESKHSARKWIIEQSKGARILILLIFFMRIIFSGVNLAMTMVLSAFTDYATGNHKYTLIQITLFALILFVIEGAIYVVESISKKSIYSRMEKKIRVNTLEHFQKSNVLKHSEFHSGELIMRLTKDTEQVANCLPTIIINLFGGTLMAIVALVYMFFLSWKMSLIILITIPVMAAMISLFNPIVQKRSKLDKENEDVNRILMNEAINTLSLMQVFSSGSLVINKVKAAYNNKYKSAVKLGSIEGIFSFFNNLMGSTMFLVTMGVGAYYTSKGEFTVGSMIAIINLLNYIVWPFSNIASSISEFNQAIVSADRIMELQNLPKIESRHTLYEVCEKNHQSVEVKQVCFAYEEDKNVLDNVNINLEKNEIVAFVGRNGSGKSTFLKILLGLYSPTSGDIRFCSDDIETRLKSQKIISYVPSSNYIFSGSVIENICMADKVDMDRVIECARKTNANEFIDKFENKYNELIGEGGNLLSSGQAQRIAIARALYHDSLIIVFDEPTSNLGQESIDLLHETIREISNQRICIIATHEKSTIEICNKIYMVENGGIDEILKDKANEIVEGYVDKIENVEVEEIQ